MLGLMYLNLVYMMQWQYLNIGHKTTLLTYYKLQISCGKYTIDGCVSKMRVFSTMHDTRTCQKAKYQGK